MYRVPAGGTSSFTTQVINGTNTFTASLTGGAQPSQGHLWMLINISGTLNYQVTSSSEYSYDGGGLFFAPPSSSSSSSLPASHVVTIESYYETPIDLYAISDPVTGRFSDHGTEARNSGTQAVTAGQYLVLMYFKDGSVTNYDDKITVILSITPS